MQFTLRDLMGLMVVVGLVLVLTPMFIEDSRGPSRANICRNNMRNLALAVIQYERMRDRYPGYSNDLDPKVTGTPNNERSWTFVILPYMDHRSLYEKHLQAQTPNTYDAAGKPVKGGIFDDFEIMVCPSVPAHLVLPGATNYVVNTGQIDRRATVHRGADFAANGVFHTGVAQSPDDKIIVTVSEFIADHDGLGTTLLMSENADTRVWSDTNERYAGFTWHHVDGQPGPQAISPLASMGINVLTGQSKKNFPQAPALGYARPSSFHQGGVNTAFCDGHVRFIGDKISYRVYQALMTPNGAAAVDNSTPQGTALPHGHGAAKAVNEGDLQ
jgi:prepilin-type processing-associated H-X9-DG protein